MMELKKEWEIRLDKWVRTLRKDIYTPIMKMDVEGFVTSERLGYDRAMTGEFAPVESGYKWGREWEYLWLRSNITIPEEAKGKQIVMRLSPGGESALYLNGEEFGARRNDWLRDDIHMISDLILTENAVPGEKFDLVLESYAGHEFPGCDFGPVLPTEAGKYNPKSPDELRCTVGDSTIGEFNETAYQLYLDVKVLHETLRHLPEHSLRRDDIWEALKAFTAIVDFEQPAEARNGSYLLARERLAPVLASKNGDTTPQIYAFGHAHIDIAWLWPIAETERKVHRTMAAQVRIMDKYPEYVFLQSQPHLYRMVKELYPKLYAKIKEKVKKGQWIPEGGMWVEADTNVSGGEALIRQFVHGKRFFLEEFGIDNKMLWLPDVFGYNAALPQIMQGCGIDFFSTQKLWWNYNGGDQFPYNYFNWVGMDGTAVPTFLHHDYNSDICAGAVMSKWNDRRQTSGLRGFAAPYGYGDGGGGPTRDFIEYIRRENDLEGCPKVKNASPMEFFYEHPLPADDYMGELYLQCHRGVQTSQAKTKKGNRKSELALRETEFWAVAAKQSGYEYPLGAVDELWKKVLLCQFHDILPGSSIARVYEEAEALYAAVLADLSDIRNEIGAVLASGDKAVTVYNSLSFERRAVITLPAGFKGATAGGKALPVQKLGDTLIAEVTVPACGTVTVRPAEPVECVSGAMAELNSDGAVMENECIKVTFNRRGEISSIFEKATGRELVKGAANEMKLYKDIPAQWEAWDVDSNFESFPVELTENATYKLISAGPIEAVIEITRKISESMLCQRVIMSKDSGRVDFDTTMQWNELHRMLKVAFDVDYYAEDATHEIQFGHIKRPNHRSRQFDYDRFEVPAHKWSALCEEGRGFAVLNDCKYGVNVLGSSINLTLLRAPFSPDPGCDRGEQKFTYSFYAYNGSFMESGIVKEGYDLNVPVEVRAGERADGSLLTVSADNIILEALKPAEDGSGDYVLRLYEAMRCKTNTTLTLNMPCRTAEECNMLEKEGREVEISKSGDSTAIDLEFRPFEIKTIRIKP